jgi:hypothetical protein
VQPVFKRASSIRAQVSRIECWLQSPDLGNLPHRYARGERGDHGRARQLALSAPSWPDTMRRSSAKTGATRGRSDDGRWRCARRCEKGADLSAATRPTEVRRRKPTTHFESRTARRDRMSVSRPHPPVFVVGATRCSSTNAPQRAGAAHQPAPPNPANATPTANDATRGAHACR